METAKNRAKERAKKWNEYVKKPVTIKAIQFDGKNFDAVLKEYPESSMNFGYDSKGVYIMINTLEGEMKAYSSDWIIRGVEGELYPCKNNVFEMTYAPFGDVEEVG